MNLVEEDYVHKMMLGLNSSWKFLTTMYAIKKDTMNLMKIKDVECCASLTNQMLPDRCWHDFVLAACPRHQTHVNNSEWCTET